MRRIIFSLLMISTCTLFSQEFKGSVRFYSGANLGWWIYNVGIDESSDQHLGFGRTDLRFILPFSAEFHLQKNNYSIGLGSSVIMLYDTEMEYSNYQTINAREVEISGGAVNFYSVFVSMNYTLANLQKTEIAANIRLGTYFIQSDHPEEKDMKRKVYLSAAIPWRYKFTKVALEVAPILQLMTAKARREKSNHSVYSFGIQSGLIWEIF